MIADRAAYELRGGGHIHLFQNARPISAHSRSAQMELLGNLAYGFSGGDHHQDLEFPRRQRFVEGPVGVIL
jgi:hypothetical protein